MTKVRVFDKRENKFRNLNEHKFGVILTEDGFEASTGWDGLDEPTFGRFDSDGYEKMTIEEFEEYQENFEYTIEDK